MKKTNYPRRAARRGFVFFLERADVKASRQLSEL
jgi:hypothetical protein